MFERRVRWLEIDSTLLAGNPMGNPRRRLLPALVPAESPPGGRFPTVWVLDGFMGSGRTLLRARGAVGTSLAEALPRWWVEAGLPPAIFLFPDGGTRLGGSQYIDSISCGPFLCHLVEELVPLADRELPTVPEAASRVLAGHSSGGYGVLATLLLRPGVFGSGIASAADSAFEQSLLPRFPHAIQELARCGGVEAFVRRVLSLDDSWRLSGSEFALLVTLAMASCYSPAPERPGWGELPFDIETAELRPAVWERWLAWCPVRLVEQHGEALRGMRHLHLDCGADDETWAQIGHRRLAGRLRERGIAHQITEFPGGHDHTWWRYRERFELLARAWGF